MRKWEDIVKDKMEELDGVLPESVFAEFRELRSGAAPAPASKRFPPVWALVPAVAAGLAAVLLLRQPSVPGDGIQIVRQPVNPVAAVTDSVDAAEPVQAKPLVARVAISGTSGHPAVQVQVQEPVPESESIEQAAPAETTPEVHLPDTVINDAPAAPATSPFIPEDTKGRPVRMKVGPAVGVIAGGGLLASIAVPVLGSGVFRVETVLPAVQGDAQSGVAFSTPEMPKDDAIEDVRHCLPIRGGLSVGIPIAERLKVTTGLAYSMYRSSFTYSLSGEKKQTAHYLGIPVRLDWTLADNGWLDVYLGGGVEGDVCLGATLGGERIMRDGFSFCLLGAGGIQFNITEHLGLYVEPELSWTIPSESHVLANYRRDHPFMFSIASGLRINLGI